MEIFLPVKNRKALKKKNKQPIEDRIIEKKIKARRYRFSDYYKKIIDHLYKTKYLNAAKKTKKMIDYFKECNSSIDSINHIRRCFLRHRYKHFRAKLLLRESHVIPNHDIIIDTYNILRKMKILKEGQEIVREKYNKIERKMLRIANGMGVETSIYNCLTIEDIYC